MTGCVASAKKNYTGQEDKLAKTFRLPGGKQVRVLTSEQIICLDEKHLHQSPILKMVALDIDRHRVEVVQDGDAFNVRIDGQLERLNLTASQAVAFVKDNTQ
jgi:hypothetical protein